MKKVVASLLSLSLVLSASVSALAAEPVKISKSSQKAASANDPYEPNDDLPFASFVNSNVSYSAEIGHNKDVDWFKFYAKPGQLNFAISSLTSEKGNLRVAVFHESKMSGAPRFVENGKLSFTQDLTKEGLYYIMIYDYSAFDSKPINPIPYAFKAIYNQ
ncbi:hypothetical protein BP422_22230 [Brevibacillus formosus]|uniref:Uncharacterized protein n=1 Tax=Brevibacillus formosus TaxID=54913 RepID=A0A220MMN8_9BACL|nr:hypothetical protein [Brevibacillus formosus]ASJ56025.1 hypothetical protein BP422_22230 [Brevibacillus formosus]